MSENERPALGSPEAAVRSIVNLISLATHTDEDKLAYWLDAYYQAREAFEKDRKIEFTHIQPPANYSPSDIFDAVRYTMQRNALATDDGPSRAPAPTEADKAEVPDNNVGNKAAEVEEPTPAIMKSSRVLPSADQAAILGKKRTRSQEAAAADKSQRAYKMRVADRLRQVRANGVTTAQIVEAGHGSVPDGAVLGIVGGEFRPIEDYRAIEAALDELETR